MLNKSNSCFYFALLLGLLLASCHKHDFDHDHDFEHDHVHEEYHDFQVDFFIEHPTHEMIPPIFETVTEQILVKEAHQVGATFEVVTETFLIADAHLLFKIQDSTELHVVQNAETNTVAEVICYDFFEEQDFITTEVPAIYQTRTRQKVISMGTGPEVPAEYAFVTKEILVTPGQIVPKNNSERLFRRINFTSPIDESFEKYLTNQLIAMPGCTEGRSYKIIE